MVLCLKTAGTTPKDQGNQQPASNAPKSRQINKLLVVNVLVGVSVVPITSAGSALLVHLVVVFLYLGGAFVSRCKFRVRGLLVNTTQCRVPDIDPLDPCLAPFINVDVLPTVCSTRPSLTYTTRHKGRYDLRVATHVTSHYGVEAVKQLQCCYSLITRKTETTNRLSACAEFEGRVTLPRDAEHVFVRCLDRRTQRQVYTHVHAVVQPQDERKHHARPLMASRGRRMSVVLIGIDSVSRLSLERSMPRTAAHLRATGWRDLRGYTKVAINTLPNVMAILTGLGEDRLENMRCLYPGEKNTYDHCPFLWHTFKAAGYETAYAEDCYTNNFLWISSGFKRRPTDFYLRPLVIQAGNCVPHKDLNKINSCYGETRTVDLVLSHVVDLVETFKGRLFGFFWVSNIGHDSEDLPASEDATMLDFLLRLDEIGALDTTMFVFLSDHGNRLGDIRFTEPGWYEYRMPFIYIHLPEWFAAEHPEVVASLAVNRDLLTTPFDLHQTLRHVLRLNDDDKRPLEGSPGCPLCGSLFAPIDAQRSCAEAGVPDTWCPCWPRLDLPTWSREAKMAAASILHRLNQKLRLFDDRLDQPGRCALLRVAHIARARRVEKDSSEFDEYEVVFIAGPGLLVYESTVRHWLHETPPRFEATDLDSRVLYVDDLACDFVPSGPVRLLCYCLNEE